MIKAEQQTKAKDIPPDSASDLGLQIIVLDRGWVYVGNVQLISDFYLIHDACCIRRWGTTKGLGQLATDGPLENTQLDPSPLVRVERRAVLFLIQCRKQSWRRYSS